MWNYRSPGKSLGSLGWQHSRQSPLTSGWDDRDNILHVSFRHRHSPLGKGPCWDHELRANTPLLTTSSVPFHAHSAAAGSRAQPAPLAQGLQGHMRTQEQLPSWWWLFPVGCWPLAFQTDPSPALANALYWSVDAPTHWRPDFTAFH